MCSLLTTSYNILQLRVMLCLAGNGEGGNGKGNGNSACVGGDGGGGGGGGVGGNKHHTRRRTQRRVTHNEKRYHSGSPALAPIKYVFVLFCMHFNHLSFAWFSLSLFYHVTSLLKQFHKDLLENFVELNLQKLMYFCILYFYIVLQYFAIFYYSCKLLINSLINNYFFRTVEELNSLDYLEKFSNLCCSIFITIFAISL